jgi:hypothetical protein
MIAAWWCELRFSDGSKEEIVTGKADERIAIDNISSILHFDPIDYIVLYC